jgi:hypothetical protein
MWIHRLRTVLRLNAVTSLLGGLAAAVFASPLSESLGIDHVAVTRLIGIGLIVFAGAVALVSSRDEATLRTAALAVSAADVGWVLATITLVAAGILTTLGAVVALVLALGVADFAAAQLWTRARAA